MELVLSHKPGFCTGPVAAASAVEWGKSQGKWSKPQLSLGHDAEVGQDCKGDCDAGITFPFSTIWITEPAVAYRRHGALVSLTKTVIVSSVNTNENFTVCKVISSDPGVGLCRMTVVNAGTLPCTYLAHHEPERD